MGQAASVRLTLIHCADVETGSIVRFNDLMQTVLAAEGRSGLGAVTLWRQCVDMLAQNDRPDRSPLHPREHRALLERLEALRPQLTETQRIATVVELGSRLRSPTLVRFFATDRPSISAAAMARAQLPDRLWPDLLSSLTPTARGVLRGRRDIGPQTRRALDAFGATDLVLATFPSAVEDMLLTAEMIAPIDSLVASDRAQAESSPAPAIGQPDQIRKLVDRIARFTSGKRSPEAMDVVAVPPADQLRAFTFETDPSGVVIWVGQGPRAALIGLSVAEPALEGGSGPDGHVAGAVARRSGFQNGRYTIVGGAAAGDWRLSATPFFDNRSGRFQGYRGQARRPYLHEVAAAPKGGSVEIAGLPSDSLRQLVHELRTPLNAILGFAEIIEQQLFGPASPEYRDMAGKIVADARHLLVAFDDLDVAAQVARGEDAGEIRPIDPGLLIAQVASRFGVDSGEGHRHVIDIAIADTLPHVQIDPVQGERMVQHFMRALISVTRDDEVVTGACWFQPNDAGGQVILALDRPSTLNGMEETQLLDPGYAPDGDWADGPLLGLGFSLRLIRSLATGCGGALAIDANRFQLSIPGMAQGIAEENGLA